MRIQAGDYVNNVSLICRQSTIHGSAGGMGYGEVSRGIMATIGAPPTDAASLGYSVYGPRHGPSNVPTGDGPETAAVGIGVGGGLIGPRGVGYEISGGSASIGGGIRIGLASAGLVAGIGTTNSA